VTVTATVSLAETVSGTLQNKSEILPNRQTVCQPKLWFK